MHIPDSIALNAGRGVEGCVELCRSSDGVQIANATIKDFISNCGIRLIGHLYCISNANKLFLTLVESWLYFLGFSYIIGSDGDSSGNKTLHYIKNYGEGYQIREVGVNRRMKGSSSEPKLYIFEKYLEKNPFPEFNWTKEATLAEQTPKT